MLGLQGHEAAIHCIRFTNKTADKGRKSQVGVATAVQQSKASEMKTIEQIREEARINIEKRMKKEEEEKVSAQRRTAEQIMADGGLRHQDHIRSSAGAREPLGSVFNNKENIQSQLDEATNNLVSQQLANLNGDYNMEAQDNKAKPLGNVDPKLIEKYIDDQLCKKVDALKDDVSRML